VPAPGVVERLRAVKDEHEIACIHLTDQATGHLVAIPITPDLKTVRKGRHTPRKAPRPSLTQLSMEL
jgi:hypothetical protein